MKSKILFSTLIGLALLLSACGGRHPHSYSRSGYVCACYRRSCHNCSRYNRPCYICSSHVCAGYDRSCYGCAG